MLSLANISSSSAATHYFEKDDYYAKDSTDHQSNSEWFGKGALNLKLEGKVEKKDFKDILDGNLPNGEELGRKENNEKVHAAGIDLTFSAPKSVSIKAEVYGDKRIYEAHKKAVISTLEYIEKELVQTRKMVNNELVYEKVDNITAALFRHNTSRNLDPQLHTHCVLANVVERKDKEWRSAHFGKVFDNKLYLGQMYRSELAYELKQLGYEITVTGKNSNFELKEIPQSLIEAFSSRAKEIEAAASDYESVDAKLKAELTIKTREHKKDIDKETLLTKWQDTIKEHDSQHQKVHIVEQNQNVVTKQQSHLISYFQRKWIEFRNKFELSFTSKIKHIHEDYKDGNIKDIGEKAVDYAIRHLSERETVWEEKDINKVAMSYATGEIGFKEIAKQVEKLKRDGTLLIAKTHLKQFEMPLTTKAALDKEIETIGLMQGGKNKANPLYQEQEISTQINNLALNDGQKEALNLILTTKDMVVGVQGYAGVGKTYMLQHAKALASKAGYKMAGMAPSASASKTLMDDAGIKSETIHKFLYRYDGLIHGRGTEGGRLKMKEELRNTILVVDESSLASTSQINGLLKVSKALDVRVVLVGDIKQLGAIESGKPFYQLQKSAMNTAIMGEIVRQKNPNLKAAVYDSINANIDAAFRRIGKRIIIPEGKFENKNIESLINTTADTWLSLPSEERIRTLITAPSHVIREGINSRIREGLKREGVLKGKEYTFPILENVGFTQAQNAYAKEYKAGYIVLFNKNYRSLGIKLGEYLKVQDVNQSKGLVILEKENGKKIGWHPDKIAGNRKGAIEVFEPKTVSIQEGEWLRWTRNSKVHEGVVNSATFKIKALNDNKVTLVTELGMVKEISANDNVLKHTDYAYASTVHAAQGKTFDIVIGVLESDHKYLTNQKQFYVTLSRARYNATLITDNKEKLQETLLAKTGERIAATEHQGLSYKKLSNKSLTEEDVSKLANNNTKYIEGGQKDFKKYNQSSKNNDQLNSSYKLPDIYNALYSKLPLVLPEFGFINRGNHYISGTERKVDGTAGKKGKVHVYANNPGVLVDYTRGSKSVWDYIKESYMPSANNKEIMEYLLNVSGLGSYKQVHTEIKSLIAANTSNIEKNQPEVKADKKLLNDIDKFASDNLSKNGGKVLDYLKDERGYEIATIKAMGLGVIYSKKTLGQYLRQLGWSGEKIKEAYKLLGMIGNTHNLTIPFRDEKGEIIGFAARNINHKESDKLGKYMYSKGLSKGNTLLNIHNCKGNELVIVEGMFDCLHANAKGIDNVVALGGTSFNASQVKLMENQGVKKITLCLDNDKAGQEAGGKIKEVIARMQATIEIKQAILSDGIKDPDQMVKDKGVNAFRELINQAKRIEIENKQESINIASNRQVNSGILKISDVNKVKEIELER